MVRVDSKGRIVLPKELRQRLDITPGTEVELVADDGAIRVERERDPEAIVERMETLIEEASAERDQRTESGDPGEMHPIAEKHKRAVERGAGAGDDTPGSSDGDGDRAPRGTEDE